MLTPNRSAARFAHRQAAFIDVDSFAFRMKVLWFQDLLRHPEARLHLFSLYYAGEAYEELHPQAVWIGKLGAPWGELLARHLGDETRHAALFRRLLAESNRSPEALVPEEDLGFYLLNRVVPDVVRCGAESGLFAVAQAQRYMAFLHVLELRSLSDLGALIRAARLSGEPSLAERLESILGDERFHATYTHRAVLALAPDASQAFRVLDEIRRAERKHYNHALNFILEGFERLGAAPRRTLGRLRWRAMKSLASVGLAAPLLPLYRTLPARLTAGKL